jgi:hypothetical protein
MFGKYKNLILGVGVVVLLLVLFGNNIIEGLTGNAPKELPLPSQLNPEDDKGRIGTYDTRFLDKREIPTGFSSESDYLLSPELVQEMSSRYASSPSAPSAPSDSSEDSMEVEILKEKIDVLTKEIEQLKKQIPTR